MTTKPLKIKFKKLHPEAQIPTKAHLTDAGFDLYSVGKYIVPGQGRVLVSTGLQFEIPKNYFIKIFDRSGNAAKSSCIVTAGVIDADYRGEVKVVIANYGDFPITLDSKTAVAQFVVLPVPDVVLVETDEDLSTTTRNEAGFGSTDNPKES
jgi:dUTP pyrophosphatase